MTAAMRWRRIARAADILCVAAVVLFLAYHEKYGHPRYEPDTLWIVGGWLAPLLAGLIALVAALVDMTLSAYRDEPEPPSALSEAEFQEKLRELEHRLDQPRGKL